MKSAYQEQNAAGGYLEFLASVNGQIQQQVLAEAIFRHMSPNPQQAILDAACGPGWLTKKLSERYPETAGCDSSEDLLQYAKKTYKGIEFSLADLHQPLPYPAQRFHAVVLNMVLPDLSDITAAYKNIFSVLKETGQLLVTLPHPCYTYPVAVWKRTLTDVVLGRKPRLQIQNPYREAGSIVREFSGTSEKIGSHFYPLAHYLSQARTAGFTLTDFEEIMSETDSSEFNLRYQLHRYPLLLLLEFVRPARSP